MNSFKISRIPELYYGKDTLDVLPKVLHRKSINRILLVTGKSIRETEPLNSLISNLISQGIKMADSVVSGEPSPDIVNELADTLKEFDAGGVVALGGGSVIDAGKAAAAAAKMEGSIIDYLEGVGEKTPSGQTLFFTAIPTTAGTGSEATKNAVLSRVGADGFKKSLRHENYIPDAAVLDPRFSLSCPIEITASSGLDALTQLVEAYISTMANPFTDMMAEAGISAAGDSLEKLIEGNNSLELRGKMAYAAYLSGICLANAGLGIVHGIASPAGALYSIPHGVVCGSLLPESILWTSKKIMYEHPVIMKYSKVCKLFTGYDSGNNEENINYLVKKLRELIKKGGISRWKIYGFDPSEAVSLARKSSQKNHPVRLDLKTVSSIIDSVI